MSEMSRDILSSVGFCILAVVGRQVAYSFLCACIFNFKQVGPAKTQIVISTQKWKVPSPDIIPSFSKF
ncbi:hypothetical protein HZH66_007920 [Vespula vulgaris]|uniref:Uncharacterized protein n=1 Tax=Vespula vulgaris TaxID=7454 RepID=A0A834JUN9_VESVU|nr:hypothetical protein HZH66_007920 [Vespula vulgaris]